VGSTVIIEKQDLWGMWHVWGREVQTGVWWGNVREKDNLEDLGIVERIVLKWIFKELAKGHGLDWSGSGCGQVLESCEFGNEPPGSIICGEDLLAFQEGLCAMELVSQLVS
jgi:hypothetical protein